MKVKVDKGFIVYGRRTAPVCGSPRIAYPRTGGGKSTDFFPGTGCDGRVIVVDLCEK